ncbi:MAG: hypothetical protein AAGI44_02310 [Pseudomonadota bacterium]
MIEYSRYNLVTGEIENVGCSISQEVADSKLKPDQGIIYAIGDPETQRVENGELVAK